MAANTRSRQQRELDRERTAELVLRGFTQRQIAAQLGVCQQQVCYDMQVIERRWRSTQVSQYDVVRQRKLEQLRLVQRLALEAWERSGGERRSTITRQRKLPEPVLSVVEGVIQFPGNDGQQPAERVEREARVRIEQRDPDPRYLREFTAAVELECKLLGLFEEAPRSPDNQQPVSRVVVFMDRGSEPGEPLPPGDGPVVDVDAAEMLPSS
jgi:hypothetical protein